MELGGREALIVLGALLIVAILLDGLRRVRRAGKGKLRVKRRRQPIFEGDDVDEFGSELPGGGARVVAFRDEDSAEQLSLAIKANREQDENRVTSAFRRGERKPDDIEADALQIAPVIAEGANDVQPTAPGSSETVGGEGSADCVSQTSLLAGDESATAQQSSEAMDSLLSENTPAEATAIRAERVMVDSERQEKPVKNKVPKGKKTLRGKSSGQPAPSNNNEEEVIIIHLMAEQGEVFQGGDLLEAVVANGLRYGSLKIFHRHAQEGGSGEVLFSMANSINPGTFELNAMAEFETPGVTFMMVLADSDDPLKTFDILLECIHGVNSAIGGALKDQQRSALSLQTAEHYRQRIMDFKRRRLTANA